MSWLTQLLGRSSAPPSGRHEDTDADAPSPYAAADWNGFAAKLAALVAADVRRFAAAHADETFYAFAIDCNAAYGDILLCANTREALRAAAIAYAQDEAGVAAEEEAMFWGLGDWKHHAFNLDPPENRQPYRDILPGFEELEHPDDCERFMTSVCRALLDAERSGGFESLRRTDDFQIACMDHDEDAAAGLARLQAVRAGVA